MYYSCIACITIDSVINFNEKNHPQVYLDYCKYRIKKTQIPKFIKNELKSDSNLDLDLDLDSDDKELIAKLEKSDFDFDSNSVKKLNFSSNINEVIRPVLNGFSFFFFFYNKILQVQKSIKTQFQFFVNVALKSI